MKAKHIFAIVVATMFAAPLFAGGSDSGSGKPVYFLRAEAAWAPVLDDVSGGYIDDGMSELNVRFGRDFWYGFPLRADIEAHYSSSVIAGGASQLCLVGAGSSLQATLTWRNVLVGSGPACGYEMIRYDGIAYHGWYVRWDAFAELSLNEYSRLGLCGGPKVWSNHFTLVDPFIGYRIGAYLGLGF